MISAILLAAGESKRLKSENKLIKNFKKKPLINHILSSLLKSKVDKIIIVLGFEAQKVRKKLLKNKKIKIIINKKYKKGISSSIKIGLKHLLKNNKGFLIVQGDMPNINKKIINQLCKTIIKSNKEIIIPKYRNIRGNPIGFKKSMIKKIYKIQGRIGAKSIIKKNAKKIKFININSKSIIKDIDFLNDFE